MLNFEAINEKLKKNDRKKLYLSKILGKKKSTTSTTTRAPWAHILTDMDTEMDRQQQQTNFTGQQKKKICKLPIDSQTATTKINEKLF